MSENNPHRTRRRIVWAMLVVFVCACCWWSVYFPYDRDRLYRAIPSTAMYVSEHENLSERWPEIVRNPLIVSIVESLGEDAADVRKTLHDPTTGQLVRRYAGRHIVLGQVPTFTGTDDEAWVLASWVGMHGQLLKWALLSGRVPGFQSVQYAGGRQVWVYEDRKEDDPRWLSVAIEEGVLLASFSKDRVGVRHLVSRIESGYMILPELKMQDSFVKGREGKTLSDAPDRGWYWLSRNLPRAASPRIRYVVDAMDETGIRGRLQPSDRTMVVPETLQKRSPAQLQEAFLKDLRTLGPLVGDSPALLLSVPFDLAYPSLVRKGMERGVCAIARVLKPHLADDSPLCLNLCRVKYAGTVRRGFGVLTLMLGVRLRQPGQAPEIVNAILDVLNAHYRMGFMPKSALYKGKTVYVVNDTSETGLAEWHDHERPAFLVEGDWLLLSSNRRVLEQLIDRSLLNGAAVPRWQDELSVGRVGAGGAWMDVGEMNTVILRVTTICTILSFVPGFKMPHDLRSALINLNNGTQILKGLGTLGGSLRLTGSRVEVPFWVGAPDGPNS